MAAPWGAIIAGAAKLGSMAIQANKKEGPSKEDPETRQFYETIRDRMGSPEADPVYQAGKRRNEQMVARSQREMAQMSGGDIATAQNAMLQAQREGAQNMNQLISQQGKRQQYFTGLASKLQQRIADRKLQLQQYDRVQAEAQKAANSRRARAIMNAAMVASAGEGNGSVASGGASSGSGGSGQIPAVGGGGGRSGGSGNTIEFDSQGPDASGGSFG